MAPRWPTSAVRRAVRPHPAARARSGAGAKVGNFVELKKTVLGAGSKANHLSYLGDATIGANVNVGAGTITCNYDGVAKHPTVIEDGAFIGSDTQLIAPVTVGTGAYVGAGSSITENVPAGALGIARARQSNVDGWALRKSAARAEEGLERGITSCAESSDTSAPSPSCRSCSTGCGAWSIAATTPRAWRW